MRIAVLALDGLFDSGLASVLDVLGCANDLRERIPGAPPPWEVETVGFRDQVRTGAGLLVPARPVEAADRCDLLLVPAVPKRDPQGLADLVGGEEMRGARELLAHTRQRGATVASACAGTFLLAEAGVLDGRRATTTWWLAPLFRQRYPRVELDQSRMVTSSDGVITAGAAFGHVDLALWLVRRSSPGLSELVSRHLVVDERPSQASYTMVSTLAQSDPVVAAFDRWVRERLHEQLDIGAAARAIGVSERTLQRATAGALGVTPVRFVQDLRVEQASHLLRTTELGVEVIARRVGYLNANTLRVLLRERSGLTAGQLRRG
ncbi:GlxA family transcriptional regulator [Kitasatospora mediocidica]|uniref:GlxA family transcriptional regulator n=1 Tax=Kitasatospora mediocidica TaxID=58352 RepID=UPI00056BAF52|nr:helix-turn-helix domain-containing protein [Kitasatospora mediocidica]